ncbi:NADH-quinone oxidoreductase subunit NuoE family protein [Anaerovorax odorimutans]|uniref:NADH-quinone oxidoreductase subunit NuoE family protein n=1 Tax=Anaerovorax odorimutans TaxID=109327 RepID=UPI000428D241|nr:NAD(P)H-dependent oxidoreductase subunit E [Anaerovorax odorimutans]
MKQTIEYEKIDEILAQHSNQKPPIVAILQDIQEEYRYLPKEIFPYLSEKLKVSIAKIYSVATFYENFSLSPKGEYIIKICDGTACHVRKSIPILDALRKELKLYEGKNTTDDLKFTVETVSCLGACGLAPVITVNDKVYAAMTPEKAVKLLNELRNGEGK